MIHQYFMLCLTSHHIPIEQHVFSKRRPNTNNNNNHGRLRPEPPLALPPLPARDAHPHALPPRQPIASTKAHSHRYRYNLITKLAFSRPATSDQVRRSARPGSRAIPAIRPAAAPVLHSGRALQPRHGHVRRGESQTDGEEGWHGVTYRGDDGRQEGIDPLPLWDERTRSLRRCCGQSSMMRR
jgi:hypothetical protein